MGYMALEIDKNDVPKKEKEGFYKPPEIGKVKQPNVMTKGQITLPSMYFGENIKHFIA